MDRDATRLIYDHQAKCFCMKSDVHVPSTSVGLKESHLPLAASFLIPGQSCYVFLREHVVDIRLGDRVHGVKLWLVGAVAKFSQPISENGAGGVRCRWHVPLYGNASFRIGLLVGESSTFIAVVGLLRSGGSAIARSHNEN